MKNLNWTRMVGIGLASTLFLYAARLGAHDHGHAHGGAGSVQYVPNKGQWPEAVRFKAAMLNSAMFLMADGVTWSRYQADASDLMHEHIQWEPERQAGTTFRGHAWRMRFVGGNSEALAQGAKVRSEYHNYYLGNDRSKWASRVPVFEEVLYTGVWPGVDMRWHSEEGQVKYDLMVAAGVDPAIIAFNYEGLDGISIDGSGDLILRTSVGVLTEMRPVAWYADDKSPLECRFTLRDGTVGFIFPEGSQPGRAIVIDPILVGATFSGQTGASNYGHCSTFDEEGNIYGGAQNFGNTFPTTVGAFQASPAGGSGTDIVVNKFSPDATQLIYATFIGGTNDDKPHSMIVNNTGGLCILGSTLSTDFPTTSGAFDGSLNGSSDIVVVHLNSDGTALLGSTYLGGSQQDGRQSMNVYYGDAFRGEIMVDAGGNIYIASSTQSNDFPLTANAFQPTLGGQQDAVVCALDPTCSNLLMSTYLGGSNNDNGLGIRIDATSIYICGGTSSSNFPNTGNGYQNSNQGGARDAYVVRLSLDGTSLLSATYFGTSGDDMAYFLELDNEGDVYLYGLSTGSIPIVPAGIYGQAGGSIFLASLSADLSSTVFTTKLGGTGGLGNLAPVAFLVDVCNRIYISGYNPSGVWETTPDALYGPGGSRFYLACYDQDMGNLLFGTYYGGSHVDGGTSRFDKRGVIYQGVCSGGQSMPTTPGAFAPNNLVGWDLGVFKIDFDQRGVNVDLSVSSTTGCAPAIITFNGSGNATDLIWTLPDGTVISTDASFEYGFNEPGTYQVLLIGIDSTSCNLADTAFVTVSISSPADLNALFTAAPISSCTAYGVQLSNQSTGGNGVLWDLNGSPSAETDPYVTVPGPDTYTFTITVFDQFCQLEESYSMSVVVPPATIEIDLQSPLYLCPDGSVLVDAGVGFDTYQWSTGQAVQVISVAEAGTYTVTVELGTCDATDDVLVVQVPTPPEMGDRSACPGVNVSFGPNVALQSILWSNGSQDPTITVDEEGVYSFVAIDEYGCEFTDSAELIYLNNSDGAIIIPNVFSPNGDSYNDVFEVTGLDVQYFNMEVYNRWGRKMYETQDIRRGWRGSVDNATDMPVPDGTYFYIINFRDPCRDEYMTERTGHVTLLR